jgi:hypothetical protein
MMFVVSIERISEMAAIVMATRTIKVMSSVTPVCFEREAI